MIIPKNPDLKATTIFTSAPTRTNKSICAKTQISFNPLDILSLILGILSDITNPKAITPNKLAISNLPFNKASIKVSIIDILSIINIFLVLSIEYFLNISIIMIADNTPINVPNIIETGIFNICIAIFIFFPAYTPKNVLNIVIAKHHL